MSEQRNVSKEDDDKRREWRVEREGRVWRGRGDSGEGREIMEREGREWRGGEIVEREGR